MPVMGALNFANCTFSDADFSWMGIVFGNIAQYVQGSALLIVCIVVYLLPIIYNYVAPKKKEAPQLNKRKKDKIYGNQKNYVLLRTRSWKQYDRWNER